MSPEIREQYFVPDTNVYLSDPAAIESFGAKDPTTTRNTVVLPMQVLAELDSKKGEMDSARGFAARETLRKLKEYIQMSDGGSLIDGIEIAPGHLIQSSIQLSSGRDITDRFGDKPDNRIIQVVSDMRSRNRNTQFVTNDSGAYIMASSLGFEVDTWRDVESLEDPAQAYKGWREVSVDPNEYHSNIKTASTLEVGSIDADLSGLQPNEYVIFAGENIGSLHSRQLPSAFKHRDGILHKVFPADDQVSPVKPKNILQHCYMDALRDDEIGVVFVIGEAGTAKTYLATDAALALAFGDEAMANRGHNSVGHSGGSSAYNKFQRLLITRPAVFEKDNTVDIGALPGDLGEKMAPWVAPIYDQIEQLAEGYHLDEDIVETLKAERKLEILVTSHMRGRSLAKCFWIYDEAQNASPFQLRTAMTRVGEGTKMILTGDPKQCDIKGMDAVRNNSLIGANEKWKDYKGSATIYFDRPEFVVRSGLAREAIRRM